MDRGKVMSRGKGSGEGEHTTLMSDTLELTHINLTEVGMRIVGTGRVRTRKPTVCMYERGFSQEIFIIRDKSRAKGNTQIGVSVL